MKLLQSLRDLFAPKTASAPAPERPLTAFSAPDPEGARQRLTEAGFAVTDEAFASFLQSDPAVPDDPTAALLVHIAMGDYDIEKGESIPLSNDVCAFEAEVADIEHMYADFLAAVDHIIPDAAITDIAEDISGMGQLHEGDKDGERSVSFRCNGHAYDVTLDSYGDWFNEEMIAFVNGVLDKERCAGRLHALHLDQILLIVYGDESRAAAARKLMNLA